MDATSALTVRMPRAGRRIHHDEVEVFQNRREGVFQFEWRVERAGELLFEARKGEPGRRDKEIWVLRRADDLRHLRGMLGKNVVHGGLNVGWRRKTRWWRSIADRDR